MLHIPEQDCRIGIARSAAPAPLGMNAVTVTVSDRTSPQPLRLRGLFPATLLGGVTAPGGADRLYAWLARVLLQSRREPAAYLLNAWAADECVTVDADGVELHWRDELVPLARWAEQADAEERAFQISDALSAQTPEARSSGAQRTRL